MNGTNVSKSGRSAQPARGFKSLLLRQALSIFIQNMLGVIFNVDAKAPYGRGQAPVPPPEAVNLNLKS